VRLLLLLLLLLLRLRLLLLPTCWNTEGENSSTQDVKENLALWIPPVLLLLLLLLLGKKGIRKVKILGEHSMLSSRWLQALAKELYVKYDTHTHTHTHTHLFQAPQIPALRISSLDVQSSRLLHRLLLGNLPTQLPNAVR
jgi:hypothetical protein